jgi:hypothetical protein
LHVDEVAELRSATPVGSPGGPGSAAPAEQVGHARVPVVQALAPTPGSPLGSPVPKIVENVDETRTVVTARTADDDQRGPGSVALPVVRERGPGQLPVAGPVRRPLPLVDLGAATARPAPAVPTRRAVVTSQPQPQPSPPSSNGHRAERAKEQQAPALGAGDINRIVDQVHRKFVRRLAIESERRGGR